MVEHRAVGVGVGLGVVEVAVDVCHQPFAPRGKTLGIVAASHHTGHPHHISETFGKEAVADMQHALAPFIHPLRYRPVAEKPASPLGVGPGLQYAVLAMP